VVVGIVVMFGLMFLFFVPLLQGALGPAVEGGADPGVEALSRFFTAETFAMMMAIYTAMLVLMMFIYAIPIGAAARLALDPEFKSSIGLGYFRFGGTEVRIGLLGIVILLILYGPQLAITGWYFVDQWGPLRDILIGGAKADPEITREMMREMMRAQSLLNGSTILALLIGAYVYARLLPAIPIILNGGPGLGIGAAWRMTRGQGMILFGTVVAAYFLLMAGFMIAAIGLILVVGLVAALLSTIHSSFALVILPIWIALMLAWSGFFFGYYQRIKVRVYQWLLTRAES
jgi:hypothetical protein